MFAALDRTFAAFARVSRPYIQETISKGPETLDAATEDLPAHASLPPRFRTLLRRAAPGAKVLGETSPTIAAALRAGIPALNRSPVLNAQLPPTADALLAFQQLDRRLQRARPADRHQRTAGPRDQVHRARADHLQLPQHHLPQSRQRFREKTTGSAVGSTRSPSSRRKARTTRRASAPHANGGPDRPTGPFSTRPQSPPHQPLPEYGFAGPAGRVRSGQRAISKGARRGSATRRATTASKPPSQTKKQLGKRANNGPAAGERHQGGGDQQSLQMAAEQRHDRGDLHPHLHRRALPGLHRPRALHQLRLRAQGDLQQRGQHRHQLAGADRRRQRRPGDLDRTRRRCHHRHLHGRRQRPAGSRRRLRRDPPPHLPRGQLLRRPLAGQPERAGTGQR